jgi:hypothetical protein
MTTAKNFLVLREGVPHLVFRQSTNLRYYKWNGAAWDKETALTLYPPGGGANPGGNPALAVDASGVAHVAHNDFASYHVNYARRGTSSWTNEFTSSPTMSSMYKRIAVDEDGHPHIVFQQGYMRHDGNAWVNAAGDPGYDAFAVGFISPGLTPSGEYLLGEKTADGLTIRRKPLVATAWGTPETVYPSSQFGTADIESDPTGDAHIALSAGGPDALDIVYVHRDGASWVSETVATTTGYHRYVHPAMAVR